MQEAPGTPLTGIKRLARRVPERQHSGLIHGTGILNMTQATARHILVETEAKCEELKQAIENGQDFADVAREHSVARQAATAVTLDPSALARWYRSLTRRFSTAT